MRSLHFYIDKIDNDLGADFLAWHCTDGISCYFGRTKAEAASHFGVPVGEYDDQVDIAGLGENNRYMDGW